MNLRLGQGLRDWAAPSLTLLLLLVMPSIGSAEPSPVHRDTIAPFLSKYCMECHGEKKQKGDVRFDTIHYLIENNEDAQGWQDVLDVLNAGEMPPEDETQPSENEFSQIVGLLTSDLSLARDRLAATGGENPIRRLNKREYLSTIKHLFGLNIDESFIPDDIRSEHFDTAGGEQYFDGPLLDHYIQIGTAIAKQGFRWSGRPYKEVSTKRYEAEDITKGKEPRDPNFPKLDSGAYLFRGDRAWRQLNIPNGSDPRASYKIRVRAGAADSDWPMRHYLVFAEASGTRGVDPETLGVLNVPGSVDDPSVTEATIKRTTLDLLGKPIIEVTETAPRGMTNISRWFPIYITMMGADKLKPNIWVDWLELEGPHYESESNVFGTLISRKGEDLARKDKARELLEKFALEAFRGVQPNPEYIDKLAGYFESRLEAGLKYPDAMAETIGLVLASPGFLYLEANLENRSKRLTNHDFANRLAYFLWSAPPDEELYQLAQSGKLSNPRTLRKQVDRMLADRRAEQFYEGFMGQWAELHRFEDISVEWRKFISFNEATFFSAHREPIEFFKVLVQDNLGVSNLIDSDFVVINPALAQFYGLPEKSPQNKFEKVSISSKNPRGGFITQSAFLTAGSNGTRSSPVIRGTIILDKILNNPPPQPPPNVPEIESASDKPLSNRKLVEMHTQQKICASCHDKIDPIGFGLENFDTVGLWRDTELVGKEEVSIDPSGTLESGTDFEDLNGLQNLLKSQEPQLARNMIESLTSYAIGRPIEFSDKEKIDEILALAQKRDFAMRDLIFLVANSETFRSK